MNVSVSYMYIAQGHVKVFKAGNGLLESLLLKEVIPHKITETYACAKVSSTEITCLVVHVLLCCGFSCSITRPMQCTDITAISSSFLTQIHTLLQ